ncbi:hypothetical protein [Saccharopolyspora spinosa]
MAVAFGAVTASMAWMLIPFGRLAGDVRRVEFTTPGAWSTLRQHQYYQIILERTT